MPCDGRLYEVLEITNSASEEEIKKAYKRMAVQHHPDKNPLHESEIYHEKFKEIKRAYEILSDKEKRIFYDRHGMEKLKKFEQSGRFDEADDTALFSPAFTFPRFFFNRSRPSETEEHRHSFSSSKPKPQPPKPAERVVKTVDLREHLSGATKHLTLSVSKKRVVIGDGDFDLTQLDGSLKREQMQFHDCFKYLVKGEPPFSFVCSGKCVCYTVAVPVKLAHKGRRIVDMPLPNGNVLILTLDGVMHPSIQEEEWTFLGEGLNGGDLKLSFRIELPEDNQEKNKKPKSKKKKK